MKIFIPLTESTIFRYPSSLTPSVRVPNEQELQARMIVSAYNLFHEIGDIVFVIDPTFKFARRLDNIFGPYKRKVNISYSPNIIQDDYSSLLKEFVNITDEVIFVTNLKQFVENNTGKLKEIINDLKQYDAGVISFNATDATTLFINSSNNIVNAIDSNTNTTAASLGIYYWKSSTDLAIAIENNTSQNKTFAAIINQYTEKEKIVGVRPIY